MDVWDAKASPSALRLYEMDNFLCFFFLKYLDDDLYR